MKIPNYADTQVTDKNGNFTGPWKHIMNQLMHELQTQMSDESHIVPSLTAAQISQLNTTDYNGGLVYNTDTNELMVNKNGTYKTVLTT